MAERSLVRVCYNGCITTSENNAIYLSDNQSCFYVKNNIFLEFLKRIIIKNIEVADGDRVTLIKYRLPISSGHRKIWYQSIKLCNDHDVRMIFDCH